MWQFQNILFKKKQQVIFRAKINDYYQWSAEPGEWRRNPRGPESMPLLTKIA